MGSNPTAPIGISRKTIRQNGRDGQPKGEIVVNDYDGPRGKLKGERRLWEVDPSTGCFVWVRSIDKDGYAYFKRNRRPVRAHRYYYELKHGPIPAGMEPDHTCRNRRCVNPDHIEVVTKLENIRRGRVCKLDMDKARKIRRLAAAGVRRKEIAARFGIAVITVHFIVSNRLWKEPEQKAA